MTASTVPDPARPEMASVLIIDDHEDILLLMRVMLEGADLAVVGQAADGVDGLRLWRKLREERGPDVVILDNQMPGPSGLEIAAQMLEERPQQCIVLCTSFFDLGTRMDALQLGITECLPKGELLRLSDLVHRLVAEGACGDG